ncbi:GIY-YIG nuclease family protein [Streptomyces sp. NPDC005227]|uniref:GIY-YIG nuclease family protein n=1 Tax=Streptomyces sp. NPDC005227 TaxID=3364707 RepID=UPI003680C073
MSDPTPACLATDAGRACEGIVTSTVPVALCQQHRMQVAISIVPEMLLAATVPDRKPGRALLPETQAVIDEACRASMKLSGYHSSHVYFLNRGDQIKIGVTTNLGKRLTQFHAAASDVLVLLVGDHALESALHECFADFRIGRTEWFARVPVLEELIHRKRELPAVTEERHVSRYSSRRGAVLASAEELRVMARRVYEEGASGVHLSAVIEGFRASGTSADWSLADLGRAYEEAGVRVRVVRVRKRISIGIHREDIQALAA